MAFPKLFAVALISIVVNPTRHSVPAHSQCGEAEVRAAADSVFARWSRGDTAAVIASFSHDALHPFFFFNYGRDVQTRDWHSVATAVRDKRPEPGVHVVSVSINDAQDNGNFLSAGPIILAVDGKPGQRVGKSAFLCSTSQFERLTFGEMQ